MSIEEALAELTAAVRENTKAHENLAAVAKAATTGTKPAAKDDKAPADEPEKDEEDEAEAKKKAAAAKRKAAAAKKKAEAEAKAKAEAEAKEAEDDDLLGGDDDDDDGAPEIVLAATKEKVLKVAQPFMSVDDEEERDANKEKFSAALKHLGASKLGGVKDDEDRGKLVTYINFWNAGKDVDFEAVDELIAAEAGLTGGGPARLARPDQTGVAVPSSSSLRRPPFELPP